MLGVVDQVIRTRAAMQPRTDASGRRQRDRQTPIEEKESCRWLEMLQSADQIARACPGTHFVCVADSEADIYELLEEVAGLAANCDFVIRACQDRTVLGEPAGRGCGRGQPERPAAAALRGAGRAAGVEPANGGRGPAGV